MIHVTAVEHIADHTIRVEFDDGSVKDVDLSGELWGEVFEPLRDIAYFRQGRFNPETRTIEWDSSIAARVSAFGISAGNAQSSRIRISRDNR